ncbi:MAG TPA: GntR family transcriptional regulator [Xanthomonadaceae bacterium]|jgi:GntR family transcriptional regulator|nr:GntR family transcriptional regulator [Xanthomonadaceae bacterium]
MDASLFHIQPASDEPIYRQIAEQVRRLVASGQLHAGDAMPSVREIASAHAINPMTVSKAYSLLEAEGVLERLRGVGMAVGANAQRAHPLNERIALIAPALEALARQSRELELPPARVLARLKSLLEKDSP